MPQTLLDLEKGRLGGHMGLQVMKGEGGGLIGFWDIFKLFLSSFFVGEREQEC